MWGWYQYFVGLDINYTRDKRKYREFGTTKPKYNFNKIKAKRKTTKKSKRRNKK